MIEEIYSGTWFLGKRGEFRKYKENSSRVWEKIKCRSEEIEKIKYSKRKGLKKEGITKEVYSKNIV